MQANLLRLADIVDQCDTPAYVYLEDVIRDRTALLREQLGERFQINYAVKANPNPAILSLLHELGLGLDVSSIGEFDSGLLAGFEPSQIGFTGPGKRRAELEAAIAGGVGEIICESLDELEEVNELAGGLQTLQPIMLRVNPASVPRKFGLQMAGQPSQFGIDEEQLAPVLAALVDMKAVRFVGFHAFSAGNSLAEDAIIENLQSLVSLFGKFATDFELRPEKIILGSGFGIPYFEGDVEIDLALIANELNEIIDTARSIPALRGSSFALEMGRWLVGPAGYMLTSVIRTKHSRSRDICICDAGFNNNLSAAGMMGTVIRRDWRFANLSAENDTDTKEYLLVGPLCASFDVLGSQVPLPATHKGDVLAIASAGAYGLSASPTAFISHPKPSEYMLAGSPGQPELLEISKMELCPSEAHGE